MALQANDLMLINRSNVSYHVTGLQVMNGLTIRSVADAPTVTALSVTESVPNSGARFTSQEFTIDVDLLSTGNPSTVKTFNAYVEGAILEYNGEDLTITSSTKQYLKFDSSGNVSTFGLLKPDPAYTSQDLDPDFSLKFPATFPTGESPDSELIAGVILTVEVTATNESGSSTVVSKIQPGNSDTQLITMSTEEYRIQQLKFLTYLNRKQVYCGVQAQAERDQLITKLTTAGFEMDDILSYV